MTVSSGDEVGCPPFTPLVLSPRQEEEYLAIGVPLEHRPLLKAFLSLYPEGKPGQLVTDALGRWCLVVRE